MKATKKRFGRPSNLYKAELEMERCGRGYDLAIQEGHSGNIAAWKQWYYAAVEAYHVAQEKADKKAESAARKYAKAAYAQ